MTIEGLGKKFQEARLARGLTLDEASRLTKIRPSRLAEIEGDDFSQFPSLAYAKGFLLIYGKFLDVDVSPYMDAFETSSQGVTVDGYSYLQEEPAPKPRRVRAAPVIRERRSGNRSSPVPLIIAVVAIVAGFVVMKLILDIQRIGPHTEQMVGVPQPNETPIPPTIAPPPAVAPKPTTIARAPLVEQTPTVAPKPSVALARAPVLETPAKKIATPPPIAAPSIAIPEAFVPAFANANPSAKTSVAPSPTTAPSKQPEVRRAEPVRPEDLAKAGVTAETPAEANGQNRVAIKPLKKTYIKVVVDNGTVTPVLERWISPTDKPIEVTGQHVAVRVLERDAIQIRKNGKPIAQDDNDITVE